MSRWTPFLLAAAVSLFHTAVGRAQSAVELDEQTLRNAGIATDDKALLQFFRTRSLKDTDRPLMEELVKKLGSDVYKEREISSKELLLRGPTVLPFLKEGLKDAPLERVRRIEMLMKKIEGTMGPEQPIAAAHILAARNTAGAVEVLLNFLPYANDEFVEEEVLNSLGSLAVRGSKIDPALSDALKDKMAARRGAAVYALGRRAELEQRDMVRQFLGDPDAFVQTRASLSLTGKRAPQAFKDNLAADEKLIVSQGMKTDESSLLEFLKKRTLSRDDQDRLRQLIKDLGDPNYRKRATAHALLVKEGTPALAFLKPALESGQAEVVRRATLCIDEIKKGPGPALPVAIVRVLARPSTEKTSPGAAIRVLLDYAPFADDESVEEEVFTSLTLLSAREVKVDPLLPEALNDPLPTRRSAAAVVLGRVGAKEHQAGLRKLLDDPVLSVRLRAAQGLLAARDSSGVPRLIALVNDLPAQGLWQVEDILQRLAGEKAPTEVVADASTAARQRFIKAWDKWWTENASTVDLVRMNEVESFLGLVTITEYDSAVGLPGGQVWEAGRDMRPRFTLKGLNGAMDAQVLPNGRILIAENSANRVTERDQAGNIKWEHRTPGNPIRVQRLPNGNTFIAMYNNVMEVTPDGKELYNINRGPTFYIFSASKLRNGNVLAMTAQGVIMEFDPIANRDVKPNVNLGPAGGWCSAEALPNGNYLVATMNNSMVREIDASGKTINTINYPGVFRATRLPNGNMLVASMTTRNVAEFDRGGTKRWEKTCEGRPWSVRYR